ncbi:Cholesterol 25-hydroxylase-like protein [Puttea exsequens]|nr:Cholesterol 25-hydroxylase-like protein [Puttea exsequens]
MNTSSATTSPIPSCTLYPQPHLLPFVSDTHLSIVLPTVVYIISSAFFHLLDTHHLFNSYRIHPSEDELKRNHVTRWDCLTTVLRYHLMQIAIGLALSWGDGPTMIGDEACRIHDWAVRVRQARALIPTALAALGIDAKGLAVAVKGTSQGLAQIIAGEAHLPGQDTLQDAGMTPIDTLLAKIIFHIAIPALQYLTALAVVDTWIYFTHRLCHINQTLYRIIHAQHHRLYISYAYGAVYGHPLESLFLDILSFLLAQLFSHLTPRQSMLFGSLAVIKTISDHCGYVFPYDPFRLVNGNGARFHDLHHQSWGLKSNFSTYTRFWDSVLGTEWRDEGGAERRYRRVREAVGRKEGGEGPVSSRSMEGAVAEGKEL